MIPKTCQMCHETGTNKLTSLYWAWNLADGARRAYRQQVCRGCMVGHYAQLIIAAEEPLLACPACGIATVDDYDAVYVTYCIPGMPKGTSEMPLCGACAVEVRTKAMTGAASLADREASGGGLGLGPHPTPPSTAEVFASLGIRPRA